MYKLVNTFPHEFFNRSIDGPLISLYQTTHRNSPDNEKDPIVFKNLLSEIENSLDKEYPKRNKKPILEVFNAIANDDDLWRHAEDGMAIFYGDGEAIIYKFNRPVKDYAQVANSFYVKPLIRKFQSADNYHVLGLSKDGFTLFEGNRYEVEEVVLDESIPNSLMDALGLDFESTYISHRHGRSKDGLGGRGNYHGYDEKSSDYEDDIRNFYRIIDDAIFKNYSRVEKTPLVLIGLAENQAIFRDVSKNTYLLDKGISKNYTDLDIDDLREELWTLVEPNYIEKTEEITDRFQTMLAQDKGSSDLEEIAKASITGRVDTVLIESDKVRPGRLDLETGEIEEGDLKHPEYGDLLNDIALSVMRTGGNVVMVPEERMPCESGLAATFKF